MSESRRSTRRPLLNLLPHMMRLSRGQASPAKSGLCPLAMSSQADKLRDNEQHIGRLELKAESDRSDSRAYAEVSVLQERSPSSLAPPRRRWRGALAVLQSLPLSCLRQALLSPLGTAYARSGGGDGSCSDNRFDNRMVRLGRVLLLLLPRAPELPWRQGRATAAFTRS